MQPLPLAAQISPGGDESGSVRIQDAPHGIHAHRTWRGSTETPTRCSFGQGWLCYPPAGGWPHAAQVGGDAAMALVAQRELASTSARVSVFGMYVDVCTCAALQPATQRTCLCCRTARMCMFVFSAGEHDLQAGPRATSPPCNAFCSTGVSLSLSLSGSVFRYHHEIRGVWVHHALCSCRICKHATRSALWLLLRMLNTALRPLVGGMTTTTTAV